MDKFNSSLFNKFKDFEKDSNSAGWESFKSRKKEGSALSNKFSSFEKDSSTAGWEAFTKKHPSITALSQKFNGYEKNTSGAGYKEYTKKKKRKAAIIFWFVKVPLIAGMIVFAFYANLKRENPVFNANKVEEVSTAGKGSKIENFNSSSDNNSFSKEEFLSNDIESTIKSNRIQKIDKLNPNSSNQSISSILSEKEMIDNSLLKIENERLNNEFVNINNAINTEEKTTENENEVTLNNRFQLNEKGEKLNLSQAGLSYLDILLDNPMEKVDFKPDFEYDKPSLWTVYFKAGMNYTDSKIIEQSGAKEYANKYYKEATENAEIPAIGYEFQLGAEYKYLRHFSFKTGIGFSKHRLGGNYKHNIDSVPLIDLDGTIFYLPPDSADLKVVEGKAGYSYSYLNIPLGIVKTYPINEKWEAIGDVSMELSVLLGANGKKLNEVYINEIEKFDANNLRKVNANLNLGLGIMRKVNKDLSIGLIATGKTYISPINTNGYFRSKNTNYGLSFIIRNNL